jgi:hypothetical protein
MYLKAGKREVRGIPILFGFVFLIGASEWMVVPLTEMGHKVGRGLKIEKSCQSTFDLKCLESCKGRCQVRSMCLELQGGQYRDINLRAIST